MKILSFKVLCALVMSFMNMSAMQHEKQVQQGENHLINSTILFLKEKKEGDKVWFQEVYALPIDPKRNCFKRNMLSPEVFLALHGDDFKSDSSPFPFGEFFGESDLGLIKNEAVNDYKKSLRWYQRVVPVSCIVGFCSVTATWAANWFFRK